MKILHNAVRYKYTKFWYIAKKKNIYNNKRCNVTSGAIRKLREDTGLNQAQFASLFGVSAATIAHWEAGRSTPPQLYLANMIALRQKLDRMPKNDEVKNTMLGFLVAGGILALLAWTFSQLNEDS